MRFITLILIVIGLTGCAAMDAVSESVSGISDYFSGGEDNADPPSPLLEFTPEIKIEEVWHEKTGVGTDEQSLKLVPAIGAGKIFTADRDGLVQARDLQTGRLVWEAETDVQFSGGPGLGRDVVILGSSNAEVLALNIENGSVLWKSKVSSEVLSVPVVGKDVVVVRSTDGEVVALDTQTGGKRWGYERNAPALSLRGTGSPLISGENVIAGYDNGKLIALRLNDGKYVWETSIAIPKGRTEIERLVDLDVDPIVNNSVIYIASYQGGMAAISEADGDVLWRNDTASSHSGLSNDFSYLYLTDSESHVWQVDQHNGASLWKQKDLHQRKLTAPMAYQSYVVVGDFEGYVHWLSSSDGRELGRIQISDSAIEATPVMFDGTVYVYAKDGTLVALRVR
ncbi:MAG: outer membrane protein assembly factor BamB [Methylococcaceae bacterium]|nr:outer membrane protein assembly factor BamB [Methylococcaceae bacterium]MDZ4155168.1 outer membrane protein assembly factor BamB [Methylococcales bacterium]MDP2394388.1 outer membrane protein assembly factor BamB [Methylococcaceae bacterium]MDP3021431.1 outer membrane protein assembly factor BamB [Methylococcaceae bacterium]MDP3388595.1 outer membrane protein assembly factor BamB [Methylococcaceae bacterium]